MLYDNTSYTNVDLGKYGLIKSNVLYELPQMRQAIDSGVLPNESTFKALVKSRSAQPGPLVLDLENLYLKGKPAVVRRHGQLLATLLRWSHEAVPGKLVGCYGLLNNTDPAYLAVAAKLAREQDAFFPSAYTFDDNRPSWQSRLSTAIAFGHRIAPGKAIYPYLWPQYHEGTPKALEYLTGEHWTYELRTTFQLAQGAVMWSGHVLNTDNGWVAATAQFTGH